MPRLNFLPKPPYRSLPRLILNTFGTLFPLFQHHSAFKPPPILFTTPLLSTFLYPSPPLALSPTHSPKTPIHSPTLIPPSTRLTTRTPPEFPDIPTTRNKINLTLYSIFILFLTLLSLPCFVLAQDSSFNSLQTPRISHPPNTIHVDKRYGIALGPGFDLITGDVVVITIEDYSPIDDSPIFNVWAQNDNGSIICIDPMERIQDLRTEMIGGKSMQTSRRRDGGTKVETFETREEKLGFNIDMGGEDDDDVLLEEFEQNNTKFFTKNTTTMQTSNTPGTEPKIESYDASAGPPLLNGGSNYGYQVNQQTSQAYGDSGQPLPIFGSNYYSQAWEPSLVHMFEVNIIDGRLGLFTLAPVVSFPLSPKYITAQPSTIRTGVASSMDKNAWTSQIPQVLTVNSFLPPAFAMYAFGAYYYNNNYDNYQPNGPIIPGPYQSPPNYSSSYQGSYNNYQGPEQNIGSVYIRASSAHGFCACSQGQIKCPYLVNQAIITPDGGPGSGIGRYGGSVGNGSAQQSGQFQTGGAGFQNFGSFGPNLDPIWSKFKLTKIPNQVVRALMANYLDSVTQGLPRSFLMLQSSPFTDRVTGIHYHAAEALLATRRLYLGHMRLTTTGTRLEQQLSAVMRTLVSDTVRFSFTFQAALTPAIALQTIPNPNVDPEPAPSDGGPIVVLGRQEKDFNTFGKMQVLEINNDGSDGNDGNHGNGDNDNDETTELNAIKNFIGDYFEQKKRNETELKNIKLVVSPYSPSTNAALNLNEYLDGIEGYKRYGPLRLDDDDSGEKRKRYKKYKDFSHLLDQNYEEISDEINFYEQFGYWKDEILSEEELWERHYNPVNRFDGVIKANQNDGNGEDDYNDLGLKQNCQQIIQNCKQIREQNEISLSNFESEFCIQDILIPCQDFLIEFNKGKEYRSIHKVHKYPHFDGFAEEDNHNPENISKAFSNLVKKIKNNFYSYQKNNNYFSLTQSKNPDKTRFWHHYHPKTLINMMPLYNPKNDWIRQKKEDIYKQINEQDDVFVSATSNSDSHPSSHNRSQNPPTAISPYEDVCFQLKYPFQGGKSTYKDTLGQDLAFLPPQCRDVYKKMKEEALGRSNKAQKVSSDSPNDKRFGTMRNEDNFDQNFDESSTESSTEHFSIETETGSQNSSDDSDSNSNFDDDSGDFDDDSGDDSDDDSEGDSAFTEPVIPESMIKRAFSGQDLTYFQQQKRIQDKINKKYNKLHQKNHFNNIPRNNLNNNQNYQTNLEQNLIGIEKLTKLQQKQHNLHYNWLRDRNVKHVELLTRLGVELDPYLNNITPYLKAEHENDEQNRTKRMKTNSKKRKNLNQSNKFNNSKQSSKIPTKKSHKEIENVKNEQMLEQYEKYVQMQRQSPNGLNIDPLLHSYAPTDSFADWEKQKKTKMTQFSSGKNRQRKDGSKRSPTAIHDEVDFDIQNPVHSQHNKPVLQPDYDLFQTFDLEIGHNIGKKGAKNKKLDKRQRGLDEGRFESLLRKYQLNRPGNSGSMETRRIMGVLGDNPGGNVEKQSNYVIRVDKPGWDRPLLNDDELTPAVLPASISSRHPELFFPIVEQKTFAKNDQNDYKNNNHHAPQLINNNQRGIGTLQMSGNNTIYASNKPQNSKQNEHKKIQKMKNIQTVFQLAIYFSLHAKIPQTSSSLGYFQQNSHQPDISLGYSIIQFIVTQFTDIIPELFPHECFKTAQKDDFSINRAVSHGNCLNLNPNLNPNSQQFDNIKTFKNIQLRNEITTFSNLRILIQLLNLDKCISPHLISLSKISEAEIGEMNNFEQKSSPVLDSNNPQSSQNFTQNHLFDTSPTGIVYFEWVSDCNDIHNGLGQIPGIKNNIQHASPRPILTPPGLDTVDIADFILSPLYQLVNFGENNQTFNDLDWVIIQQIYSNLREKFLDILDRIVVEGYNWKTAHNRNDNGEGNTNRVDSLSKHERTYQLASLLVSMRLNSMKHQDNLKSIDKLFTPQCKTQNRNDENKKQKLKKPQNEKVQTEQVNLFQHRFKPSTPPSSYNTFTNDPDNEGNIHVHLSQIENYNAKDDKNQNENDQNDQNDQKNNNSHNFSPYSPTDTPSNPFSSPHLHTMKTAQIVPGFLNSILPAVELRVIFGIDADFGTVQEATGEYALLAPPKASHLAHMVQHMSYAEMPFSMDLSRYEFYWFSHIIGKSHLQASPSLLDTIGAWTDLGSERADEFSRFAGLANTSGFGFGISGPRATGGDFGIFKRGSGGDNFVNDEEIGEKNLNCNSKDGKKAVNKTYQYQQYRPELHGKTLLSKFGTSLRDYHDWLIDNNNVENESNQHNNEHFWRKKQKKMTISSLLPSTEYHIVNSTRGMFRDENRTDMMNNKTEKQFCFDQNEMNSINVTFCRLFLTSTTAQPSPRSKIPTDHATSILSLPKGIIFNILNRAEIINNDNYLSQCPNFDLLFSAFHCENIVTKNSHQHSNNFNQNPQNAQNSFPPYPSKMSTFQSSNPPIITPNPPTDDGNPPIITPDPDTSPNPPIIKPDPGDAEEAPPIINPPTDTTNPPVLNTSPVCLDSIVFEDAFNRFVQDISAGQRELWDLDNPIGLVHPAFELHHFALTGRFSRSNAVLLEFIPEKITIV